MQDKKILAVFATIAGMLCGVSFGVPIKSSIGAAGGKFVETRAPSAADYIQDGLVVMWDGIENFDWGVHDSEATEWVDLMAGLSLPVVRFDEDCATMGIETITDEVLLALLSSDHFTVEFLTTFGVAPLSGRIECLAVDPSSSYWNFTCYRWGTATNRTTGFRYLFGSTVWKAFPYTEDEVWTCRWTLSRNGNRCRLFFDNGSDFVGSWHNVTEPSVPATALKFWRSGSPKIYALRIYNRFLSDNEILYNYVVDTMRFGL